MIEHIRTYFEKNGFDVVSRMADKLGIRASRLRLLFIYLNFVTLGSMFLLYLNMAFFLWIKDSLYVKRPSVFDL